MRFLFPLCLVLCLLMSSGCTSVVQKVGVTLFYKKARLSEAQVRRDVPYDSASPIPAHRLDLFLPQGEGWPVFVFVHGGGWTGGDKGLRAGGADVYGNIGRFYAARGIGVAVINYRLQPGATWQEQVDDVARATAWVHAHIADYHGDPQRIFIGGHSAGAQLADRIALDSAPLARYGLSPANLCGVISVSGAGLDIADERTYALGASSGYYEQRFGSTNMNWRTAASPATFAQSGAPPFLILYARGETKPLQRQSQRLGEVLSQKNIPNQVVGVPGQSHARMVLIMSRADKIAGSAILRFIQTTPSR